MNSLFGNTENNSKPEIPKQIAEKVESHQRAGYHANQVEINWDLVKQLCGIFCTLIEISAIVGVSSNTLVTRVVVDGYAGSWVEFYDMWSSEGKVSLRRMQFKKAIDGNTEMLKWLGKQYLQQSDKNILVTDQIVHDRPKDYDLGKLNTKDLKSMEKLLTKLEASK